VSDRQLAPGCFALTILVLWCFGCGWGRSAGAMAVTGRVDDVFFVLDHSDSMPSAQQDGAKRPLINRMAAQAKKNGWGGVKRESRWRRRAAGGATTPWRRKTEKKKNRVDQTTRLSARRKRLARGTTSGQRGGTGAAAKARAACATAGVSSKKKKKQGERPNNQQFRAEGTADDWAEAIVLMSDAMGEHRER